MSGSGVQRTAAAALADAVRAFYERHPYPPPVDDLDRYRRTWNDPHNRRTDAHLFWPGEPYREDRAILVAGRGTAQAAKYAIRWPQARVTGIDVSETRIRSTEVLKRKYNLVNLEVHLLPIEDAVELGLRFESVICTGVLHHLQDPDTGLGALREVMEPGGDMHLRVYAPHGRAGVYLLQDYCRRLGIGNSPREIRELATSLQGLPPDHPLVPLLRNAPDFRREDALADALLNPRDRPYSVSQLMEFIEGAGLRFRRWLRQAPYLPQCGALASSPHRALLEGLSLKEQYAAAELSRGTMVRHSVILFRPDDRGDPDPIRFHGDACLDFVPIRIPGTLCVEERLPPGAAAVLINPSHTYTDIYLPISPEEKRMFDAIDGKRTISEILEVALPGSRKVRRLAIGPGFFQRLWWYDQVVVDASDQDGRPVGVRGLQS